MIIAYYAIIYIAYFADNLSINPKVGRPIRRKNPSRYTNTNFFLFAVFTFLLRGFLVVNNPSVM